MFDFTFPGGNLALGEMHLKATLGYIMIFCCMSFGSEAKVNSRIRIKPTLPEILQVAVQKFCRFLPEETPVPVIAHFHVDVIGLTRELKKFTSLREGNLG